MKSPSTTKSAAHPPHLIPDCNTCVEAATDSRSVTSFPDFHFFFCTHTHTQTTALTFSRIYSTTGFLEAATVCTYLSASLKYQLFLDRLTPVRKKEDLSRRFVWIGLRKDDV